jgi:hypothetical protein
MGADEQTLLRWHARFLNGWGVGIRTVGGYSQDLVSATLLLCSVLRSLDVMDE